MNNSLIWNLGKHNFLELSKLMSSLKEEIQYDESINDNTYILENKDEILSLRGERSRLRKVLSVANSMIPKYEWIINLKNLILLIPNPPNPDKTNWLQRNYLFSEPTKISSTKTHSSLFLLPVKTSLLMALESCWQQRY